MLLALLALSAAAWIPARWSWNEAASLELLAGTPVNCLLVEQASREFAAAAAARGVTVLAVARPGAELESVIQHAIESRLAGVVLEGAFDPAARHLAGRLLAQAGLTLIELLPRAQLRLDSEAAVIGTAQGLWPGIRVFESGAIRAAPTGSPWVETNTGFLRHLRAATDAPIWIANLPPAKTVVPVERYLGAIADAAIAGARWVVALDGELERRLAARDPKALAAWKRIAAHLKFYEDHAEWRSWKPAGQLAIIQDEQSGALLGGGIVDMIAARHVPVRVVPRQRLNAEALRGARLALNVDPASLSDSDKEVLRSFTRGGGTLLSGPPGWKFPMLDADRISLDEAQLDRLTEIWREVNSLIGRRNLGARLFNVSGMLSNLLARPDGRQAVLHLVNYTSYPAENITVHLAANYSRALLLRPEEPSRELALYRIEEGVGVEIDRISSCAALLLDWRQ